MIVDAHTHVFLSADEDPQRTVDELAPADRRAPVDLLEADMTAAGVDGAVLVPLGPEDAYVADIVGQQPQRFAGIAVGSPQEADAGAVAARLDAGGFRGLRLFSLPGRFADGPPWRAVLERLSAAGRVLWLYPRAEDLDALEDVAAALPELRIVLNHCGFTQAGIGLDELGRPRIDSPVPRPHEPRIRALARHPHVAVILSGAYAFSDRDYPYDDVGQVVHRLVDAFGTDRVAWASDFPWIRERPGYRACLELVDHHLPGLSKVERDDVLGGTIRRLLDWRES